MNIQIINEVDEWIDGTAFNVTERGQITIKTGKIVTYLVDGYKTQS
jgi:hypothetical protein